MSSLAVGSGSSVSQQLADKGVDTSDRTVLIVEDAPDTLTALSLMLQVSGYKVVAARDGLDALHKFEREQPDLVILDLDLPTVSGFRLIRLFRQNKPVPAVPVVVVTAYDYEEAEEVTREGAADLITKPFDARDLLASVAFALRRSGCGSWLPSTPNPAIV